MISTEQRTLPGTSMLCALLHGAGVETGARSLVRPVPAPSAANPIASLQMPSTTAMSSEATTLGDWASLLNAVKTRLTSIVGDWMDEAANPPQHPSFAHVQSGVLDCAAALEQLHFMLDQELKRRQELELQLHIAEAALTRARLALGISAPIPCPAEERQQ